MKVRIENILIDFTCSECKNIERVLVTDIIEVGTPLCTICKDNPEMFYGDAIIIQ